jgi:hypothetical protein
MTTPREVVTAPIALDQGAAVFLADLRFRQTTPLPPAQGSCQTPQSRQTETLVSPRQPEQLHMHRSARCIPGTPGGTAAQGPPRARLRR